MPDEGPRSPFDRPEGGGSSTSGPIDDRTDHTVESPAGHPVVAPPTPAESAPASPDDDRWRPPSRTGGALVEGATRSWPVWLVPTVAAVVVAAIIALVVW